MVLASRSERKTSYTWRPFIFVQDLSTGKLEISIRLVYEILVSGEIWFSNEKKRTIRFFLIYPVYAVPLDTD